MTNDLQTIEEKIKDRIDTAAAGNMIVSTEAGGLDFANVGQVMEFAKMMAVSQIGIRKHLRGNPGACLAVCVQAIEWRMSPFAVANKSYLVNDQIAYEAQLVHAVILARAPIKGRPKHAYSGSGDEQKLTIWAELRDEPGEIVEYESPAIKDISPKNSPLWKNDPPQQLHYYAVRAWCRRHFPDVILGVYAADELPGYVGPDNAKDVTPASTLAERLAASKKSEEGFSPAFVEAETSDQNTTDASPQPTQPASVEQAGPEGIASGPAEQNAAAETGDGIGSDTAGAGANTGTAAPASADQSDVFPGDLPAPKRSAIRRGAIGGVAAVDVGK